MAGMRAEGCVSSDLPPIWFSDHFSESDPFDVRADRPDEPVSPPKQSSTVGFRLYVRSSMVSEMTNRSTEFSVGYSQFRAVIFFDEPTLNLGLMCSVCTL